MRANALILRSGNVAVRRIKGNYSMTQEQERHLKIVQSLVEEKYRSGAEAHKDTDTLIDMSLLESAENALAEAIDQVVYLSDHVNKLRQMNETCLYGHYSTTPCPEGWTDASTIDDYRRGMRRYIKGPDAK